MQVEVVYTSQIACLLQEYVNGHKDILVARLSDKWTLHHDTVYKLLRRIEGKERKPFIELDLADGIVVALDAPEIFRTGRVRVLKKKFSGKMELQARVFRKPKPAGKRCPGPFCKGRHRSASNFYRYKSGRQAGQLRSYCKRCDSFKARKYREEWKQRNPDFYEQYYRERNIRNRKHREWQYYGYVPYAKVEQIVQELCQILGPTKAARRIGVSYGRLCKWRRREVVNVRSEYAARILRAQLEVGGENGSHKT